MSPNNIKAAMLRGETVVAMWSSTGSPDLAEAAVHRGWPTILIDNEHGVGNLDTAVAIHRAVLAAGGDCIIRVPSSDPTHLKLVADRGFRSIMVPMINTAADAKAIADATRYPPRGMRGYAAPVVRGSYFGANGSYMRTAHEDFLLIAQIEHKDAVDNIKEIAAVDGIDCLFLGPNDMAGSIGKLEELDHPDVLALCERVEKETLAAGKLFGSIVRPERPPVKLKEVGCTLIAGPSDLSIFLKGAVDARADFPFIKNPAD